MLKITLFLMLICLLCVLPGCENPTGENSKNENHRDDRMSDFATGVREENIIKP